MINDLYEIKIDNLHSIGFFTNIKMITAFIIHNTNEYYKKESIRDLILSLTYNNSFTFNIGTTSMYVYKYRLNRFKRTPFILNLCIERGIEFNKTLKKLILDEFTSTQLENTPENIDNLIQEFLLEFCFEYDLSPSDSRKHEEFIQYMVDKLTPYFVP